ncbi:uncharacterized protein LOC62_06G007858 [Vanrija pseudolonga]|uniref:Uncharacterized protein n=1 Tax=Vanrija pseudolonga TaxID=143232 RepID=A0AAF0YIS2_9TREE|nr:hypothetical protein LOC62_06G007858 [Vanrija pseudolonga]
MTPSTTETPPAGSAPDNGTASDQVTDAGRAVPQTDPVDLQEWLAGVQALNSVLFTKVNSHTTSRADTKYTLTAAIAPTFPVAEFMELTLRSMLHEMNAGITFTSTWTGGEFFDTFTIYPAGGRPFNRVQLLATARHFCSHVECDATFRIEPAIPSLVGVVDTQYLTTADGRHLTCDVMWL